MLSEIKKSINASLYERFTSPLWGAMISSWIIINWQALYITLFGKEEYLGCGKLEYIVTYLYSPQKFYFFPLLLTLFILVILPFLSNGAYYLHLKFRKWKEVKRNKLENKTPLTIEQSIKLREALRNQEAAFNKITEDKDSIISELRSNISELGENHKFEIDKLIQDQLEKDKINQLNNEKINEPVKSERDLWKEDFKLLKNNEHLRNILEEHIPSFSSGVYHNHSRNYEGFSQLVTFGLVEKNNADYWYLTEKGKFFGMLLTN